jgi:tetratricopeptide (TPR) repeat protein
MEQIPESMRKMLDRGEATMGEVPMEELTTPAYMRRAYLMDLYRFFRLYPNRQEFENPFAVSSSSLGRCEFFSKYMFKHSPLEAHKDQIVRLLIRQKLQEPANILLDTYDEDHRSVQYYIWREEYDKALELEPGNERAMRGKARQLFDMGIYDEAEEVYDELLLLHPDDATYLLYKAICQIRMREFDKAQKLLYRLNYENPDDDKVNRVLAWTLLCCHQLEQADKIYQRLTSVEKVYPEDWQNAAYCYWFSGKIDKAIDYFRKYIDAGGEEVRKRFCFDLMLLERYNISQPQVKMMEAAVLS